MLQEALPAVNVPAPPAVQEHPVAVAADDFLEQIFAVEEEQIAPVQQDVAVEINAYRGARRLDIKTNNVFNDLYYGGVSMNSSIRA